MINSLKTRSINGLKWTSIEYIITFTIQLAQLTVLARMLTPVDFGIFAIGTFFTTLGNSVFALGLGPALIQKQGEIKGYLNTAWTANLLISIFATAILLGSSYLIVDNIFNSPEALWPAIAMLSVVIISGLNNISIVRFYKEIELKRIFILNIFPKIIGVSTMIGFAFYESSYWALVLGIIVEYSIRCIASYLLCPIWPKLELDLNKFKELYSFGGWLQLKNLANWLAGYMDVAIVGNLLGTEVLGFYNRAQTMARIPQNQINSIINTISFPLYAKVIGDKKRLQKIFDATNDLVLIIIFPLITIVLLLGHQIVLLVLGEQWVYLTGTFQLLIVGFSIQSYIYSFYPLLRAMGYPKLELFFQLMKIGVLFIIIYPLTKYYGITGAGFAVLIAVICIAPLILYRIKHITNLKYNKIRDSLIVCICTLIILLPGYFILNSLRLSFLSTIFGVLLIGLSYLGIILLFSFITGRGPGVNMVANFPYILNMLRKKTSSI